MQVEKLSLEQLVRIVRNEHPLDTRPNKKLDPVMIEYLYRDYKYHDLIVDMAKYGFDPIFEHAEPRQRETIPNHKSARSNIQAVEKFLAAGQADQSILLLPASLVLEWRNDPTIYFHTSPYGVVPKKGEDTATDGRVISDLSFPRGNSLNEYIVKSSIPKTDWRPASQVGARIYDLQRESNWEHDKPKSSRIFGMVGDINAAFRNCANRAKNVKWFGFYIPELDLIAFDMCAPFGWTASPMYYGVFGNGISWLVRRESPATMNPHLSFDNETFYCYEWVDDYILLEIDSPGRLAAAETALRLAMTLSLGHTAIHPTKFSDKWEQKIHYLGLNWCLQSCTVSMPRDKIEKAISRIKGLMSSQYVTRTQLQQAVGTLRHVCTCIPAAKPFYQRLQSASNLPSGHKLKVCPDLIADCLWFQVILEHGQLQNIPVSIFAAITSPNIHLYSDACDAGLVILDITRRRYILVEFDEDEREAILRIKAKTVARRLARKRRRQFGQGPIPDDIADDASDFSINVREFFAVVLAFSLWGSDWNRPGQTTHVRSWIDNSAAVAWLNKLASPNKLAQQLLRTLGLTLAKYRLHQSGAHLPGSWNYIADHGSRSMISTKSADIWSLFSNSWRQTQVPTALRYAYKCGSQITNSPRWPTPPENNTNEIGKSGAPGANPTGSGAYCHPTRSVNRSSCAITPSICSTNPKTLTEYRPSSPKSAVLAGVIKPPSTEKLPYLCNTSFPFTAWPESGHRIADPNQPHRPCCEPTTGLDQAILRLGTTPFGAALSLHSSSPCEHQNMQVPQTNLITTYDQKTSLSLTPKAKSPTNSRTPQTSICFSEAAKTTRPNADVPETSPGQASDISVRSSLRGACAMLAGKSNCSTQVPPCASTMDAEAHHVSISIMSQHSRRQPTSATRTHSTTPLIPFGAEAQPRCSLEDVPTQQSNSSVVGSQMPTRHTYVLKRVRTLESLPE